MEGLQIVISYFIPYTHYRLSINYSISNGKKAEKLPEIKKKMHNNRQCLWISHV